MLFLFVLLTVLHFTNSHNQHSTQLVTIHEFELKLRTSNLRHFVHVVQAYRLLLCCLPLRRTGHEPLPHHYQHTVVVYPL
uniref:Putative secreted protein n=1 Tax=Anopheles darlingi TaxID=43151 RepID=A0A2M4D497_ANODA